MTWSPPSKVGDTDPLIPAAKDVLDNYQYGQPLKAEKPAGRSYDARYTQAFGDALRGYGPAVNDQIRKGKRTGPYISAAGLSGVFDWTMKTQMGLLTATPVPPPAPAYRPIYFFSAPGSGANNLVGPSSDVGNMVSDGWGNPAQALHLNHWRLNYPVGGYLGLMGGDPGLSYIDVIDAEGADLEVQFQLAIDDVKAHGLDPLQHLEGWFSSYSQGADGMKKAVVRLFGDSGRFAQYRSRINGLILFGDPSRAPGPVKRGAGVQGYNPKGYGIARYDSPQWVDDLTWSITTDGDMYACTEDDTLLAGFYRWFIAAETSLSFVEMSAGIVIPAIASYLGIAGPLIGGIFGPVAAGIIGAAVGVGVPFLTQMFGSGALDDPYVVQLRNDLSAQGLLTIGGITKLFKTLAALPGIDTHGRYWDPRAEFGGRTGVQVGYDIVASFTR